MYRSEPFDFESLKLLAIELPDSLKALRYSGRFTEEAAEIDRLLLPDTCPAFDSVMIRRLKLERFIASRLADQYILSPAEMSELISENICPSFTEKDIPALIGTGHTDYVTTPNGIMFHEDAYANVRSCCDRFFFEKNNPGAEFTPEFSESRHKMMDDIRRNGKAAWRFTLTESIMPSDDTFVSGKSFRAWLPFPAVTPEQSDIELLAASHKATVNPGPIATVYGEFTAHKGEKFEIRLRFVNTAVYHDFDENAVRDEIPPEARPYLVEEAPHILFTPYLKMLTKEICGNETNPLKKARRIFDYITHFIRYSYMREYRLIDNIPMYAAVNGRGDCGVQALLFITLCRIAGVPARWQSGNSCSPDGIGSHDWALFYAAPYGWLHADPSYGGGMVQNGDEEGASWYCGNFDPNRYITCTEFLRQLSPEKKFMRLDPCDNQSGEAEYEDFVIEPEDVRCVKRVDSAERLI